MAAAAPNARRTLSLIALAVVSGTASAEVLERGGTVRVVRDEPLREWHLYVFVPHQGDQARLQGLSPATPGQRYSILDELGHLGEATVKRVDRVDQYNVRCPGEYYYEAEARFERTGGLRPAQGWMLAVGPSPEPLREARVVPLHRVKRKIPPLVRGKLLSIAIDLDGDGDPDLFQLDYHCDQGQAVTRGTGRELCLELWGRKRERWEVVASARTPICDHK
jgi:hypothetical protein